MPGRGRGAARGGRGRGRGRGRGGSRGRSAHARQLRQYASTVKNQALENAEPPKCIDIDSNSRELFLGSVTFDQHYKGQKQNRDRYAAAMATMVKSGYELPQNVRVRSLAAAWARNDTEMASSMLTLGYGLVEVLKAVTLLDAGRCARVVEKKIKRLQVQKNKVSPKKLGKLKSDLDNLNAMKTTVGSASNYVCKQVRKWVKTLSASQLEFFALYFSRDPWKKLADICHFHPAKDFEVLPWFLPYCFGGDPPEDSMVSKCKDITRENVNEFLKEFPLPYSHIKKFIKDLTDESKGRIAVNEAKLDTVLWYYEDLQCKEVDTIIKQRLGEGQLLSLETGKMMERLLVLRLIREGMALESLDDIYFKWDWDAHPDGPTAISAPTPDYSKADFYPDLLVQSEERLKKISLPLHTPIVVMGDASGSMEVAIRTSSIIAGILTAITSAKLVFFDDNNREAPFLPKTVEEALNLAISTKTGGGTTPAASLYPFYKSKEVIKTFIVVTDEEENGSVEVEENGESHTYMFHDLFELYHKEVYPAKLVFVSFLSQTQEGEMVAKLKKTGIQPLQYKFDKTRPDLSKLDHLFGLLSTETVSFEDDVYRTELAIGSKGVKAVFDSLNFKITE